MSRFSTPPGVTATSNERRRLQMSFVMTRTPTLSGRRALHGDDDDDRDLQRHVRPHVAGGLVGEDLLVRLAHVEEHLPANDEVPGHVVQAVQELARLDAGDVLRDRDRDPRAPRGGASRCARWSSLRARGRSRIPVAARARAIVSFSYGEYSKDCDVGCALAPAGARRRTTPTRPAIPTRLRTRAILQEL